MLVLYQPTAQLSGHLHSKSFATSGGGQCSVQWTTCLLVVYTLLNVHILITTKSIRSQKNTRWTLNEEWQMKALSIILIMEPRQAWAQRMPRTLSSSMTLQHSKLSHGSSQCMLPIKNHWFAKSPPCVAWNGQNRLWWLVGDQNQVNVALRGPLCHLRVKQNSQTPYMRVPCSDDDLQFVGEKISETTIRTSKCWVNRK